MKLNPNKRIGKVLYLVEGDVDEVLLLCHIFSDVLHYSVVTYDKRQDSVTCLSNPNDKYSKVFIVPMKYSAISRIESSTDYIECIYNKLKSYGLEKDECAKYLIFDRDKNSNSKQMFEHLFDIYKNSLDNDLEINGLLLVSYPCIQSFVCECFNDETRVSSSALMKKHASIYNLKDIKEEEFLIGSNNMIKTLLMMTEQFSFDVQNLDNMSVVNKTIISYQDNYFEEKGAYITLSLLFISFIDLGIIEI